MQDYFRKYAELMRKLEEEENTLKINELSLKQASDEYDKTIDLLNSLSLENTNLEKEIEKEIEKKSAKLSRRILLGLLLATLVSLTATIGNFNATMAILLSSACLSAIANIISPSIIKKWYKKNNSQISKMEEKILENKKKIKHLSEEKERLFQERRKANISLFSQKEVIRDTEEAIKDTMVDYATPIFNKSVKIRKKTRD